MFLTYICDSHLHLTIPHEESNFDSFRPEPLNISDKPPKKTSNLGNLHLSSSPSPQIVPLRHRSAFLVYVHIYDSGVEIGKMGPELSA